MKKIFVFLLIAGILLSTPLVFAVKPETTPPVKDHKTETTPTTDEELETLTLEEEDTPKDKGLTIKAAENGLNKGNGQAKHLYLYQKLSTDWSIVKDGAWGKMNLKQYRLVFNAHGLTPGEEYSLIYYPDPWPGTGLVELGCAIVNEDGNIHIKYNFDFSTIPFESDDNNPEAKIWLVLKSDIEIDADPAQSKMIGWNPDSYLFEYQMIFPGTLFTIK